MNQTARQNTLRQPAELCCARTVLSGFRRRIGILIQYMRQSCGSCRLWMCPACSSIAAQWFHWVCVYDARKSLRTALLPIAPGGPCPASCCVPHRQTSSFRPPSTPAGNAARNARMCAKFYRWPCGIGAKTVPAAYSHNIPIENLRLSIAIFVSLWYNIRRRSGDSFRSPLRGHPT